MPNELTDRERAFCAEFVASRFNASAAAIAAGYSAASAAQEGSRLLRRPRVAALISAALEQRMGELEVAADRVLIELASVAFSDLASVCSWGPRGVKLVSSDDLSQFARAAVKSVTVRPGKFGNTVTVSLHDKHAALQTLSRVLGLLRPEDDPDATNAEIEAGAGLIEEAVERVAEEVLPNDIKTKFLDRLIARLDRITGSTEEADAPLAEGEDAEPEDID